MNELTGRLASDARNSLRTCHRIVVKIGSSSIVHPETGALDLIRLEILVRELCDLKNAGKDVILVSSGAIAAGRVAAKIDHRPEKIEEKQACAAIGQAQLMMIYQKLFHEYGHLAAQILLTKDTVVEEPAKTNTVNTFEQLLAMGVIPIVNENDTISTYEIQFGDNDSLSATVAALAGADLLILMSDIDGLYTGNPKSDPDAKKINEIADLTEDIFNYAKGAGSTFSTGGMKTKLLAAQIAQKGGCGTMIVSGYDKDALIRSVSGEEIGTYIFPEQRLAQRQRWIANTAPSGKITVDEGAENALTVGHKSLLPSGIRNVEGIFNEGDVIEVITTEGRAIMKAVTSFNSSDLLRIMGRKTKDITKILCDVPKVVFRPEDSVYL